MVWRYDPIVMTSLTPAAWHRDTFAHLAAALSGSVDEVTVSMAQIYRKTERNMDRAAKAAKFGWRDPDLEEKRELVSELVRIAADRGLRLTVCTQPDLLVEGAEPAHCIDAERLSDVAGRDVAAKTKGNRPGCLCAESRDIGAYDTCPHGCVYCYAVSSRARARERLRTHDPAADRLG
jgi:hypothetical protein